MAGRQRTLTQLIAKDFFLIAKGYERVSSKESLVSNINLFNSSLGFLVSGSDAVGVPPAPSETVLRELQLAAELWTPFKQVLEDSMDNNPVPQDALNYIYEHNLPLLAQADRVVSAMVNAAHGAGVEKAGLQVNTAGRQRTLSQKMSKDVVLVALGINATATAETLKDTMELFASSHEGLLRGEPFLGLEETKNICVLRQMMIVSHEWKQFREVMRNVYLDLASVEHLLRPTMERSPVLLEEMDRAVNLYIANPSDCSATPSIQESLRVLNALSEAQLELWECSRLYVQIAGDILVSESTKILFSHFETATELVRTVIEGRVSEQVVSPVTQRLADTLINSWNSWAIFQDNARMSIGDDAVGREDVDYALRFASAATLKIQEALELYLAVVKAEEPSVPAEAILQAARLSSSVEQLGFESALGHLTGDSSARSQVEAQLAVFAEAQDTLLRGRPASASRNGVNRTTDVCVLRHMQQVNFLWQPLLADARTFIDGNTSVAVVEKLADEAEIIFPSISEARRMYTLGPSGCQLTNSDVEWEASIHKAGRLHTLLERILTQLTLDSITTARQPWAATTGLPETVAELHRTVRDLLYGETGVPTPPTQELVDSVLAFSDAWTVYEDEAIQQGMRWMDVEVSGNELSAAAHALLSLYAGTAATSSPSVASTRIMLAATQPALLQTLAREVARLGPGPESAAAKRRIAEGMSRFEVTHQTLLAGTPDIPVGQPGHLPPTTEGRILPQMRLLLDAFNALKPLLQSASDEGILSLSSLPLLSLYLTEATEEAEEAAELYLRARMLGDLVPARVLMPLPLSGERQHGHTMKVAIEAAQEIINNQQLLLPGVFLDVQFVDDGCDQDQGMRALLQQITQPNASWVGIGGMSCSSVCASTAIVASAVRLPVIGHVCPADYLSDQTMYPGFMRLGTPKGRTAGLVSAMAQRLGWTRLLIFKDASDTQELLSNDLGSALEAGGLTIQTEVSAASSWPQLQDKVRSVLASEVRHIFLIGSEDFMRKVLCASKVVGIAPGVFWLFLGPTSRGWVSQDDPQVLALDPTCTGSELLQYFQGALEFRGRALPDEELADAPLDCLQGFSSRNFTQHLEQRLAGRRAAGDFGTAGVYDGIAGLSVDGTCAMVFMLRSMIQEGFTMAQLSRPTPEMYGRMLSYLRVELNFSGVSGDVHFNGNTRPSNLGVWQVSGNGTILVGQANTDGGLSLDLNGGLSTAAWRPHPLLVGEPPYEFPWLVLPASFLGLVVLGAIIMGMRAGLRTQPVTERQLKDFSEMHSAA